MQDLRHLHHHYHRIEHFSDSHPESVAVHARKLRSEMVVVTDHAGILVVAQVFAVVSHELALLGHLEMKDMWFCGVSSSGASICCAGGYPRHPCPSEPR